MDQYNSPSKFSFAWVLERFIRILEKGTINLKSEISPGKKLTTPQFFYYVGGGAVHFMTPFKKLLILQTDGWKYVNWLKSSSGRKKDKIN